MADMTEKILEVAQIAGRQAAQICRLVQARVPSDSESMAKVGKEPVTVADYGSQAVILRAVQQQFPDHGVIAEEGAEHLRANAGEAIAGDLAELVGNAVGDEVTFDDLCGWIDHTGVEGAEYTWVIDPIDGTKGFLRRQQYAIAIGLLRKKVPYAGVLVCPNLPYGEADGDPVGVAFVAAKGQGVLKVALDEDRSEKTAASTTTAPAASRILGSVESAHGDPKMLTGVIEDLGIGGGIVRIDSQAKYGMVACGGAEIYLRPQSRPDYREKVWDHVAGVMVVLEAGGRVTDVHGNDLDFSLGKTLENNRGVVATNGTFHDELIASLKRLGA